MTPQSRTTNRLVDIIAAVSRPVLLVSLPQNDPDLGKAAVDAGAEGLKVHINLHLLDLYDSIILEY